MTGYKDAADVLLAHLKNAGGDPRKFGPPIAFLYRHHLELAIKALARQCNELLGRNESVSFHHKLDELWQHVLSAVEDISPGVCDAEEVTVTTRLLREFCRVDPNSQTFRYPEDRDGRQSLSGEVELETMATVVGKISLLLDCLRTDLHERCRVAF